MAVLRDDMLRLIRSDNGFREELRRELLTDELLGLPAQVAALVQAQRRTEARLEQLAEAQQRTVEQIRALVEAQQRTDRRLESIAEDIRALNDWRRGDQGQRDGERYERDTVRHAMAIFGGGRGALQTEEDLLRVQTAVEPLMAAEPGLEPGHDPFLADVLWLKGDRIAVAEVSMAVDRYDVERAELRAATLRRAGLDALPVVIGRGWATEDVESVARMSGVEWRVGADSSPGYLAYRRMPAAR